MNIATLQPKKRDIQFGNFALGKIASHQIRANEVPKGFRKKTERFEVWMFKKFACALYVSF